LDSNAEPSDPSAEPHGDGSDEAVAERDTARSGSPVPHKRLWVVALLLPLVVAAFVQLDSVQTVKGHLVEGLPWNVGKWDVIVDFFSPAWAISIIVLAALNRVLLDRFGPDPDFSPTSRLGQRFGTDTWVRRSTWIATGGAVLLIILSYTREWEKFGEWPDAYWFILVLVGTLAILAVPWVWVRLDLEEAVRQPLEDSRPAAAVHRYLFKPDGSGHVRWAQLVALAALTILAAWVALGQLDALLRGMHLTNQASYGVGSLSDVSQLDLSRKPGEVTNVVSTWLAYSTGLGPRFATARSVLGQYLLIDTVVLIPSYVVLVGVLLIRARAVTPPQLAGRPRRSYDLLIAAGASTLIMVAIADAVENLFTWIVVNRSLEGASVADWSVRLMWSGSLIRTVGLVLLIAGSVVILALRRQRLGGILQSMVAVRGELLVLTLLAVALTAAPQTADVVRRWTVSVTLITIGFAIALAMVLQWTSSRTLHGLWRSAERVAAGETLEPASVTVPGVARPFALRRLVVIGLFAGFVVQIISTTVLDIPIGLRLGVPVLLIAILWLFGLPLPASDFDRGDRQIAERTRRTLPRLLGASVFVVLGATVIKAAVAQLVFARHIDWWLLFAVLPIAVGLYRLHTRTGQTMGRLEAVIFIGVGIAGGWMILTGDDPELSAAALTIAGLMILYGTMPFYYSYDPSSAPSTFARTRMRSLKVQPILAIGLALAMLTALGLILFPLDLAPAIGTTAVVLLGATFFAAVAAALVGFAEWTRPPDILAAFWFRRTPVFVILLVWLLLAGGGGNDVTMMEANPKGAMPGITTDDVWARWLERNPDALDGNPSGERVGVPAVFVASSGGGLRAAAWTGYVMDCIFGGGDAAGCETPDGSSTRSILAMSGVSGGSLGLAGFAGASLGAAGEEADWVKARLGDDYLAAAVAWLTFVDTPQTFLGFAPSIQDRAAMMERAFERSWSDRGDDGFLSTGVFEIWHDEPELPVMIFNGTSVKDPCRFNLSVIDANAHTPQDTCTSLLVFEGSTSGIESNAALAATQDLVDYLCPGEDIKLSTAALLSARFPIISPSAKLGSHLERCREAVRPAYVVDGGYLEGSAAGTLVELWDHFEARVTAWNADDRRACIVPFFVQIDNGYENPGTSPGGPPREALVPLAALLGSQFGRIANAREQAAIEFDQPLMSAEGPLVIRRNGTAVASRYARLVTRAHPGVQAPLGWTLSTASFDDLRNQLLIDENQAELAEVMGWLDGHLTCTLEVEE